MAAIRGRAAIFFWLTLPVQRLFHAIPLKLSTEFSGKEWGHLAQLVQLLQTGRRRAASFKSAYRKLGNDFRGYPIHPE
jgi:hypothetical protein